MFRRGKRVKKKKSTLKQKKTAGQLREEAFQKVIKEKAETPEGLRNQIEQKEANIKNAKENLERNRKKFKKTTGGMVFIKAKELGIKNAEEMLNQLKKELKEKESSV